MWEEYAFGVGEYIAAKDFTTDDLNGQGKAFAVMYGRRNWIWRIQAYPMRVSYTIEAANSRIVEVYGSDKITPLSIIIKNDQKQQDFNL